MVEQARRERGLDAIRAIAIARVVVWHTFGAAFITYFFAAVPAMFFVTGSLLAKSLQRRPARVVITDRLRRVLVPLWAYAALAFLAMATAWRVAPSPATRVPWRGLFLWLVPIADPRGSGWEGGHLSSALWYLRALLWLIVLAPLLLRAVRRCSFAALVPPLLAVFALDAVSRHPTWRIAALPDLVWQAGDIALYSIFLMLGFLHRHGRIRSGVSAISMSVIAASASGAVAWRLTQPVPRGVVNNSHPMHLLVGTAWLFAALAALPAIERLSERRTATRIITPLTRRSLTIYLWHPAAIWMAYRVLGDLPLSTTTFVQSVSVVVIALTMVLAATFGWLEDLAAGRAVPARTTITLPRIALASGLCAALLLVDTASISVSGSGNQLVGIAAAASSGSASGVTARRAPIPSQGPPSEIVSSAGPDSSGEAIDTTANAAADASSASDDAAPSSSIQAIVEQWAAHYGMTGVRAGVLFDGTMLVGASDLNPDATFEIASVTKAYTAAIIYTLVDEGLLDLDAPLPYLPQVPDFPYNSVLTVRELLSHTSGLVNYRESSAAQADPTAISSPEAAVSASGAMPLLFEPGTQRNYSSTNYLVLGFVAEVVGGANFDHLLASRIIEPLGLTATSHSAPRPGEPNFSTAGIVTDIADLLQFSTALFGEGRVIGPTSLATMTEVTDTTAIGAGAEGWCPCTYADDGSASYHFVGHIDAHTVMLYSRDERLAIAITFDQNLYEGDNAIRADVLVGELRRFVLAL